MRRLLIGVLAMLAGCASEYAYTFHVTDPAAADPDLGATVLVDAATQSIELDLLNKTDQVVQVQWAEIAITRPDGKTTKLHPDVDLGWVQPGRQVHATLLPLALPHRGDAAARYQGQHFELDVPVIVRREPRVLHFTLASTVREL